MERNITKIGLANLMVSLAIVAASIFLAIYANTMAGQVGAIFLGVGFLIVAVSYFQMRLEDSERLEKLEFEELNKARSTASLFNSTDAEAFPAQRSREQFERFFTPAFTVLLLVLQLAGIYWISTWIRNPVVTPMKQPAVAMSLFALFALVFFLVGKYSAGISRIQQERLLRPGASYLLLGAYLCFAVAGCVAAVQLGFPWADLYAARALAVLLILSAVETLVSLILEIYRPRIQGKPARVMYESRLVGLLAQPEGLFTTAAQALDYQFGFKVSETWFYRFLEKALAWLILLQLGVLMLSTCVVFIGPGEQAVLERFGAPLAGRAVLDPGVHFKLPWPVDKVYRHRAREIQSFNIGFEEDPDRKNEKTVVWTMPHYKEEFNLLVASQDLDGADSGGGEQRGGVPADLLTVSIPVQYQINDLKAWFYNHTDAGKLLEKVANREVVRYLVGVDLFDIMSSGREKAAEDLKRRIQAEADSQKLGVEVMFVGLQDIHPPVKVASAFQDVNGAKQAKQAKLREAEGYAARVTALSRAEATNQMRAAEAYRFRTVADAQARAARFTNQLVAYKAAPEVFKNRAYLEVLERGMTNSRKYVLAVTNTQDVVVLNLEDKLRPDFMDVDIPGARK